jgi:hypothetical protein
LSGGSTHSPRRKMRSCKKSTGEQSSSNGRTESIKGDEILKSYLRGSKQLQTLTNSRGEDKAMYCNITKLLNRKMMRVNPRS